MGPVPTIENPTLCADRRSTGTAASCRYDCVEGCWWAKLVCTIHPDHRRLGVVRMTWAGYDTLTELLRLNLVTG